MKRFHAVLIVASAFLGLFAPVGLARPTPDVDYKLINPPQPAAGKGVEVLEFFNYACPHCYEFEPNLKSWLKNKPKSVEFVDSLPVSGYGKVMRREIREKYWQGYESRVGGGAPKSVTLNEERQ